MKRYPDVSEEIKYLTEGTIVVGIDEVGRGCLAGPVCAAAVCPGRTISEIHSCMRTLPSVTDSKMMTKKAREEVVPKLKETVCAHGIAYSSASDINRYGIVEATAQAMVNALGIVHDLFPDKTIVVLVDGRPVPALNKIPGCIQHSYIKGDSRVWSISAASVIAKVDRDNHMMGLHNSLNKYGWNVNKGYATAYHRQAIRTHGLSDEHRTLFVRNVIKAL